MLKYAYIPFLFRFMLTSVFGTPVKEIKTENFKLKNIFFITFKELKVVIIFASLTNVPRTLVSISLLFKQTSTHHNYWLNDTYTLSTSRKDPGGECNKR